MKKRILSALFCVLLLGQLIAPAQAAKTLYFVAAEDRVLELSDDTMPFWNGGYLYIASSIFTGDVRTTLGISNIYNSAQEQAVIYSNGKALLFDLSEGYATDPNGNTYYPGALLRGDTVFVPAAVVADYFELNYSVIEVPQGYLVWLRSKKFKLSERLFADAASFGIAERYEQYLKTQEGDEPSTQLPGTDPEIHFDRRIYLCMTAGESTSAQLDVLARRDARAAFFCPAEFLEEQGDLLRRMAAEGHAIGILANANDPERTVEEQLSAGNAALYRATCGKTRLVYISGSKEAELAAREAGYCPLEPDLVRTGYRLSTTAQADALYQRINDRRGDVKVWLGDTATTTGLRAFLADTAATGGQCQALRETA